MCKINLSKNKKLTGKTATLGLTNTSSLTIKINDSGDGLEYQYNYSEEIQPIEGSEIEYTEDTENVTGYGDDEENCFQPSFTTSTGVVFFIGEFMRDNY